MPFVVLFVELLPAPGVEPVEGGDLTPLFVPLEPLPAPFVELFPPAGDCDLPPLLVVEFPGGPARGEAAAA